MKAAAKPFLRIHQSCYTFEMSRTSRSLDKTLGYIVRAMRLPKSIVLKSIYVARLSDLRNTV